MYHAGWWTLAAIVLGTGPAQDPPAKAMTEYELKAEFLYRFAKYVDWPKGTFEKPDSPIVIGIVGSDPFGASLDKFLKDRKAQDRKFVIERYESVDTMRPCHILFVPRTERDKTQAIFKRLEGRSTLTVGESEGFAESGGAVNILIEKERARLEINVEAAGGAKLTIQARLLKVATVVKAEK